MVAKEIPTFKMEFDVRAKHSFKLLITWPAFIRRVKDVPGDRDLLNANFNMSSLISIPTAC